MKKLTLTVFVLMLIASGAMAGTITGTVSDSNGDPVMRAVVYLPNCDRNGDRVYTYTNRAGEFTLEGLDAGVYTVCASLEGYGSTREQVILRGRTVNVELTLPGDGDRDRDRDDRGRERQRRRIRECGE